MEKFNTYEYINVSSGLILIKQELGIKNDFELAKALKITRDSIIKMKADNFISFKTLFKLTKLLDKKYVSTTLKYFEPKK